MRCYLFLCVLIWLINSIKISLYVHFTRKKLDAVGKLRYNMTIIERGVIFYVYITGNNKTISGFTKSL